MKKFEIHYKMNGQSETVQKSNWESVMNEIVIITKNGGKEISVKEVIAEFIPIDVEQFEIYMNELKNDKIGIVF